jgi:hypothetical protein
MRPAQVLLLLIVALTCLDAALYVHARSGQEKAALSIHLNNIATSGLGLTDLCISTEARYTRHPSQSDPIVPFMDHPGAMEHFPSGSFWAPPLTVGGAIS